MATGNAGGHGSGIAGMPLYDLGRQSTLHSNAEAGGHVPVRTKASMMPLTTYLDAINRATD